MCHSMSFHNWTLLCSEHSEQNIRKVSKTCPRSFTFTLLLSFLQGEPVTWCLTAQVHFMCFGILCKLMFTVSDSFPQRYVYGTHPYCLIQSWLFHSHFCLKFYYMNILQFNAIFMSIVVIYNFWLLQIPLIWT